MAWCRTVDKPLSEPMVVSLLTHTYASLGLNELIKCCYIDGFVQWSYCSLVISPRYVHLYRDFHPYALHVKYMGGNLYKICSWQSSTCTLWSPCGYEHTGPHNYNPCRDYCSLDIKNDSHFMSFPITERVQKSVLVKGSCSCILYIQYCGFWWPGEASKSIASLRWRHNGRDGVSNHQPHDCLLNLLFGRRSK